MKTEYINILNDARWMAKRIMILNIFHSKRSVIHEYSIILLCIIVAILLTLIIIITSYFLAQQKPNAEKKTAYECGFEPYEDGRNRFHIRFYVVAILFIIFDIEIIFFLPWCASLSQLNLLGFWSMIEFLLELTVGFIYVWSVGAIEWD